jgi:hypothetical protein
MTCLSARFLVVASLAFAGCSANADGGDGSDNGAATNGAGGGDEGSGGSTAAAGTGGAGIDPSGVGGGSAECNSTPDSDVDADGYTGSAGDCNDCDANVSPGAIEVAVPSPDEDGNEVPSVDEDCNGEVDEPVSTVCDDGIVLDSADPADAARAIGLCKSVGESELGYGLLEAAYVRADGQPAAPSLQHGIMSAFGGNVSPRAGSQMLVLSSGHARIPGQAGACKQNSCSGYGAGVAPAGFPQDVPGCQGAQEINDDIGLEVRLRAPTNATGYSFDFDFYSFEYPEFVCTDYNDQFISLVSPPPMGSINGNISFDSMSNPVSVNIAFFQVCAGCALGEAELAGTGFGGGWDDDAGATSWLTTKAPVEGGSEVTIRFALWDTGDDAWDSTVLLDNFQWIATGGTVTVVTDPVPK